MGKKVIVLNVFSHIAEHMDVPIDTSKMSDQELQFHYFKMHDADNNNKLDGCELIKSLIHWHGELCKVISGCICDVIRYVCTSMHLLLIA